MNTRILMLQLNDGIPQLDSRMTISVVGTGGGSTHVKSITRVPGGYLVGYKDRTFVVHDARVACAEVEDLDKPAAEPVTAEAAPLPPAPPVEPPSPNPRLNPAPGEIGVDQHGRFYRAPKEAPPAPEADPRHAEAEKYVPRSRRKKIPEA